MSPSGVTLSLRRTAQITIAVAAFVTALSATSAAVEGHTDAGVVFDPEAAVVVAVSPTGFAWRAGIRPGQHIATMGSAEDPGGWSITTDGPVGPIVARAGPIDDALRASLAFAFLAVGASALSVFLLRTNRAWVAPAAAVSLLGASVPLFLANRDNTGLTLVLATAVPSVGVLWLARRARLLVVGAAIALSFVLAAWWLNWAGGSPAAESFEQVRRALAVGATAVLIVMRALNGTPSATPTVSRLHLVGDAMSVVLVGGTLGLLYLASAPGPVIFVVMVLGLLAALPVRAYLGRRLEFALAADLRAQLSADVAEEERSRLARELHDVPLQHLAGVIRRLELVPGTRAETRSLLEVADELRAVAIELHPPMLDDLGLGAALDFLAERLSTDALAVDATISDTTAPYRRPPTEVELAVYRIANEAATNAIKHARATAVLINASISESSVDLQVSDDGVGLTEEAMRAASGRGRIGLGSMRRRAQGIDADLTFEGGPTGTTVKVTWRR